MQKHDKDWSPPDSIQVAVVLSMLAQEIIEVVFTETVPLQRAEVFAVCLEYRSGPAIALIKRDSEAIPRDINIVMVRKMDRLRQELHFAHICLSYTNI